MLGRLSCGLGLATLFLLVGCGSDDSSNAAAGGAAGAAAGGAAGSGGSAGSAAGGGAGGTAGGGGGSGGAGAGGAVVGMFVAQGHMGRTTISCDDGKTWTHDQSDDDAARCFESGFDCDHNAGAANGIVFIGGAFFATYGWGTPGGVRKSSDGKAWTEVLGGTTFGGMAAGNGVVLGAAREPQTSSDQGSSWTKQSSIPLGQIYNIREAHFTGGGDGRFVLVGNDGASRAIAVSADGKSFTLPSVPPDCDISFYRSGGIAAGGGAIVISDGGAKACRSTDQGATWASVDMGSDISSLLLHDGARFVAWKQGALLESSDGQSWKQSPTTPANLNLGAVAASDAGTYVAVRGGWSNWYDKQRFYRSDDGITWNEIAAGNYTGSHPIIHIAHGKVPPSACAGK
jgi:hypothetical protein